jgi:hypothetical protein
VSCEKKAKNVDLPVVQPVMVASAFLCPTENATSLFLSWSNPIFHNSEMNLKPEKDADVYIINQGIEYKMHYDNMENKYVISKNELSIKIGETYKLKVVSDKSKTLTATTTIPEKPIIKSKFIRMDSIIENSNGYNSSQYIIYVDLKITNSEPKAYYRITAFAQIIDGGMNHVATCYIDGGNNRIIYGDFDQTLRMYPSFYSMDGLKLNKMYIVVEKVDETFYRYHHALEAYSDMDFFVEPTQVYSNVENGFGAFCSHNIMIDSLDVK